MGPERFWTSSEGSLRSHLILTATAILLIRTGKPQADMSRALIWSTTDVKNVPMLIVLYGNPDIYIPQLMHKNLSAAMLNWINYTSPSGYSLQYGVLETNYRESLLYFYNDYNIGVTERYIPNTGSIPGYIHILFTSDQVTGMSFDWVSRQLYWSDAGYQRIGCIDGRTFYWKIVVDTNITSPQDVAVHPQQSYMFWIDSVVDPKIIRLNLINDERTLIASKGTLPGPKRLAIDFANQRLFWLDPIAATIGSINFDGSGVSIWSSSFFSSVSSFVFYKDYVFLGSNTNSIVHVYNVTQRQYLTNITTVNYDSGVIDVTLWCPEKEPHVSSPCSNGNGGCSQFCITVNATSRKCSCGTGFFLDSDEMNCVTRPLQADKFLLLTDYGQFNVYQIDVVTGEVRAMIKAPVEPAAIDCDLSYNCFYWFDDVNKQIMRTDLDNGDWLLVLKTPGIEISSLAFDNVTGSLFYADYQQTHSIGQVMIASKTATTLLAEKDSQPMAIVLDTQRRLIYWSDCHLASIESAAMTNLSLNRSSAVGGLTSCVKTFAIDFQGNTIYFGDEFGIITSANLDGTDRKIIHRDSSAAYKGVVLDYLYLYIADSNRHQIQRLDRKNMFQVTNLTKSLITSSSALVYCGFESTPTGPLDASALNTTVIIASAVSGSVVLIAVIVTTGFAIKKRRRIHRNSSRPQPPPPVSSFRSPSPSYERVCDGLYDYERDCASPYDYQRICDSLYHYERDDASLYDVIDDTTSSEVTDGKEANECEIQNMELGHTSRQALEERSKSCGKNYQVLIRSVPDDLSLEPPRPTTNIRDTPGQQNDLTSSFDHNEDLSNYI